MTTGYFNESRPRLHMRNKKNEGKVCDAVMRAIEKRTSKTRTHVRRPEADGVGPPVDLRLKLGGQEYAIEHTRIEPYDDQIKMEVIIREILGYFKESISLPFPSPAYYELQYPIDISLPDGKVKRNRALKSLANWVCKNELLLRDKLMCWTGGPYDLYHSDHSVHGKPDGFKCVSKLRRWPYAIPIRQRPGSLFLRLIYPEDMEPLIRKRLMRALSRKCEKLQACKAEGARTVLVLESRDVALTSFEFRGDLLPGVLAKHSNALDEIFLVETYPDPWWVFPLKHDDGHWPDTGMPELGQNYYDPNNSDIPKWLDTIPQHMRDGLQLDHMHTPYVQGFALETFKEDELNDLALERVRTET